MLGNILRPGSYRPVALADESLDPGVSARIAGLGIRTVIDAGAHVGEFAAGARKAMPGARILSFEPVPEVFARLTERMGGDPLWTGFPFALGDAEGEEAFHVHAFSPISSLLPIAKEGIRAFPYARFRQKPVTVRVRRLDAVLAGAGAEGPYLLKIDVQGYEDRVVRGMGAELGGAAAILAEVSHKRLYEGQMVLPEWNAFLAGLGFRHALTIREIPDFWGRPAQADALYLRA